MYVQVFATQMYISWHDPSIYKFSQHQSIYACMTQVYIRLHNTNINEFTLHKYIVLHDTLKQNTGTYQTIINPKPSFLNSIETSRHQKTSPWWWNELSVNWVSNIKITTIIVHFLFRLASQTLVSLKLVIKQGCKCDGKILLISKKIGEIASEDKETFEIGCHCNP